MVDTHCHLEMCAEGALERARSAGVKRLGAIGMGRDSTPVALAAAAGNDDVFAIVGFHPNGAEAFRRADVEEWVQAPKVVAVGETGLDWYRDRAGPDAQRRSFEAHLEIAADLGLPVVIHMRDSAEDTFAMLREFNGDVVLHCFSEPDYVDEAADRGWYCSFAGNVTFPKATGLHEAARNVPDHLLLVETDAPFLSPQPLRGKPNESANVVLTARHVAELRGVPYEELEAAVDRNAARVFGW